jgi:hypothetical protein
VVFNVFCFCVFNHDYEVFVIVPPGLPMELSLAVNNSLLQLQVSSITDVILHVFLCVVVNDPL